MRPFRFGVQAESARTPALLLETARRAEAAGFSTLLLRDHLVEGPFEHQLAPLTALGAVAAATTALRVGTLVLGNDMRHPAVLAKDVATLDVLSGGRVELGLGAGFLRREYELAGMPFDRAGERVSRLEESLRALKALFGDGPATFHGRHYTIDGLDAWPRPAQRPHPPLLVAAAGPRMLGIAGREADIVCLQGVTTTSGDMTDDPAGRSPETVAAQVERVRQAAAGRSAQPELSTNATIVLTNDERGAAERLASARGWTGTTADEVLAMPSLFIGSLDRVVERFHERRDAYGLSYYVLSDTAMDAAAPVVDRLVSSGR